MYQNINCFLACVQEFFNKYDTDGDGYIDFNEFVLYVKEHEKDLKSYFKRIDTNKDGGYEYK